ncbi:MAG: hypothetical protein LUC93_04700 [Planctomycetaceae bacterium]|nr:hypothetical protein [Planctomycetaceae bacterium]
MAHGAEEVSQGDGVPSIDIPDGYDIPESEPLSLDISSLPQMPSEEIEELFTLNSSGHYRINPRYLQPGAMTPEAADISDNDPVAVASAILRMSPEYRESAMRQAFVGMNQAARLIPPHPDVENGIIEAMEKTGYPRERIEWLRDNDPETLNADIKANQVLKLSGVGGYTTQKAQDPNSILNRTHETEAWADLEYNMRNLGYGSKVRYETSRLAGSFVTMGTDIARAGYDFHKSRVAASHQRALDDLDTLAPEEQEIHARSMSGGRWTAEQYRQYNQSVITESNEARLEARDASRFAQAWLEKKPIKTDSWLYNNFVQPATGVAPSLIAGLLAGPFGAGVIALSYGSGTYNRLIDSGVDAGPSAAMAIFGGIMAYGGGNIGLKNINKMFNARTPLGIFNRETVRGVAVGGASNAVQSIGQTLPYAFGRNVFREDGSTERFFSDVWADRMNWAGEAHGGAMFAFLSRLAGIPFVARSQYRSVMATRSDRAVGQKAAKTDLFKKGQDAILSNEINNTARHNNVPSRRFITADTLSQAGVSDAEAVSQLNVTTDDLNWSRDTGGEIAVPLGNAVVFTERQKANGNNKLDGAFKADPADVTVAQLQEQANEVDAVIKLAENKYTDLTISRGKPPARIEALRKGLVAAGTTTAGVSEAEANAAAAVMWARAERAAEQWGETIDQFLERVDVQLEFDAALADAAKMTRYRKAIENLRDDYAKRIGYEAPADADADVDSANDAVLPTAEGSSQTLTADRIIPIQGQDVVEGAAQSGITELSQPVIDNADNDAWVDGATQEITKAFGLQGEEYAPLVGEIRSALQSGLNDPNVREIAERMGVELPSQSSQQSNTDNAKRLVKVIEVDPSILQQEGVPIDLRDTKALSKWIVARFNEREVEIHDDGTLQQFTKDRLKASLKRRGKIQRQVYAKLDEVLENAVFDGFEPADARHPNLEGQNVYYSAVKIGDDYYGIRFKVDLPKIGSAAYKDHKVIEVISDVEVEKAPPLDRRPSQRDASTQQGGAIRNISLPVIKGLVKPTRMILDSLYQDSAGEAGVQTERGKIYFPEYFQTTYGGDRANIAEAPHVIRLFKNADISTVLHELNHLFINDLRDLVQSGKAIDVAMQDWAALVAATDGRLESSNPDERRQAMEQIAGNWERYLMTGKAPRADLLTPFDNIRKWMTNIYRNAVEQAGELPSSEVAAVFDRLLATDDQIAASEFAADNLGYLEYQVGVIQDENRERIRKAREKVRAAKRRKADAETAGKAAEGLQATAIAAEAEVIAKTVPVYKAMESARTAGGLDRDTVQASIGAEGVKAITERHGENIFGEGTSLDAIADENGFTSPDAMLAAIAAAEPVNATARRRITEQIGDAEELRKLQEESEGRAETDEATDPEAELIETEMEVGFDESARQDKSINRETKLREYHERRRTMRQAVTNRMMAMPFEQATDIRAYQSAKNAASKLAFRAALRASKAKNAADATKHWAEFQRQKEIELLHHMEIQGAKTARKVRDWVKRNATDSALASRLQADRKHPRVEDAYAEALKDEAAFMGWTRTEKMRPAEDSATLLLPKAGDEQVSMLVPDLASNIEPWLVLKIRPDGWQSWQDFTLGQVLEAQRVFTKLLQQGRGALNALHSDRAENLQKLVLESIKPMARRDDRAGQFDDRKKNSRLRNWWNRFLVKITIPENWFMAMDGNPTIQGKESGINHDLFYKIRNCEVVREEMKVKLREMAEPHYEVLKREARRMENEFGGSFFTLQRLPVFENLRRARDYHSWTAENLISMMLNMGNDANLYALMEGYGLKDADVQYIQSLVSKEGWNAIQGIWDMVDSLAPALDALSFRMINRHMTKELPRAFTATAADGEVELRGGYYPLVFDPLLSERGARSQAETEDRLFSNQRAAAFRSAAPQDGMLNARLRDSEGRPVVKHPPLLKLDVLAQHLEMTTHLISHAETLSEFDRLTRDPVWKGTYIDKFGQEQWNAIRKWLQDLARPGRLNNEPGMEFLLALRGMATVNGLGLRPSTSLKQRLGPFQAYTLMNNASQSGKNSLGYLINGVTAIGWGGNIGFKTQKMVEIDAKSEYMRVRDGGQDRDLRALRDSITPLNDEMRVPGLNLTVNKKWLHDQMFIMIKAMDRASAYSVWYAAYQQAVQSDANFSTEGLTNQQIDEKAVKYADLITASQSSSFRADLTEMQRSGGLGHFMTMFMSGNVRQAGRLLQYLDANRLGDKSKMDILSFMLQEHMFPAAAWVLTRAGLLAMLGIYDPEDEDIVSGIAWNTLGNATAAFPYIREVSSLLQYNNAGRVPALDAPSRHYQNLKRGVKAMTNAEYGKAARNFGDVTGYVLQTPIMNLYKDLEPLLKAAGIVERD